MSVFKGVFTLIFFTLILPNYGTADGTCNSYCLTNNEKPSAYMQGATFRYYFDSEVDITVASAELRKLKTKVKADVYISSTSACRYLLQIKNLEIFGDNSKKYTGITGIEKPIFFKIENGVLNDQICTDRSDTHNSLNIKRAVASLFQVDTSKKYQTDIFGSCPTVLEAHEMSQDKIIIKKSRNLNQCAYREHIHNDFILSTFDQDADVQSTPLLQSSYQSEQTLSKEGILHKGRITEMYANLDSTQHNVSVAMPTTFIVVTTSLSFGGIEKSLTVPFTMNEPKSIIFENPHPISTEKTDKQAVFLLIQKLSHQYDSTLSEYSSRDYKNLIKILRDGQKTDLLQYYNEIKNGAVYKSKEIARKIFLDALFHCGTSNAVAVGVELLKHKELNKKEEKLLFVSFGFVKHPTLVAVEAALDLVENHVVPREAYLGIGSLAGRYCRQASCQTRVIDQLTATLSNRFADPSGFTKGEENDMIFVLKALANIDQLNNKIIEKVINFIKKKGYPSRLRAAALDTLSSNACNRFVQNYALEFLLDTQEDTEIRIKAYLVLAKCPNHSTVEIINRLLKSEESYQVGGFITSHARAIAASKNSGHRFAKYYLSKIHLNNKFPYNPLKYSYSEEYFTSMDSGDGKLFTEANLIYSQKSFLPRSGNLNLTAEVFGHNINFFELGIRQQNLDKLVEHYFGPLGVFNKATPKEVSESGQNALQKIIHYFNSRLETARSRRDVSKAQIEEFGKKLQTDKNDFNNEVDLDLSIKLFGSELLFLSLADDTEKMSPESIIDRFFDSYEEAAKEAFDFEKSYHSNTFFLDSHLSYPTSSGFPVKISIEGTSLVQVKTKGNVDLKKLFLGVNDLGQVKLSIIPSASIEVTTKISLDTQLMERGISLVTNLNTATGGEVNIDLSNIHKGIDFKYYFPIENQNIISVSSETIINSRDIGHAEENVHIHSDVPKNLTSNLEEFISNTGLDPYVSVNDGPHGNYFYTLGIRNKDFSHFHLKWSDTVDDKYRFTRTQYIAEIIDKNQRQKASALFEISRNNLKTQFKSTIFNALAEVKQISTDTENSMQAEVIVNDIREYVKIGVILKESNQKETRFAPLFEHSTGRLFGYNAPSVRLTGDIISENMGHTKVTFENLQLIVDQSGNKKTYSLNGNIGEEKGTYVFDLVLSDDRAILKIYEKYKILRNNIDFEGKLENNIYPEYNFRVIYKYNAHPNEAKTLLELTHGDDLNSEQNRLTISKSVMWKSFPNNWFKTTNKLTYPALNLLMKVELAQSNKTLFYDAEYKYKKYLLGSKMDLKYEEDDACNYDLKFKVYDSKNMIAAKSKCDQIFSQYKIANTLSINQEIYDLSGIMNFQIKKSYVNIYSDLNLKIPHLLQSPLSIEEKITYDNIMFKVSDSQEEYINIDLFVSDKNPLIGLKFYLKDYIDIKGNMYDTDGKGNGELTIEYLPVYHLIKVETTHMINRFDYNVLIKIYPDYKRSPAEYVTLTSNTHIERLSVNSINELDVHGEKYTFTYNYLEVVNLKRKYTNSITLAIPGNKELSMKHIYDYNYSYGKLIGEQSLQIVDHNIISSRPNTQLLTKLSFKNYDENNSDGNVDFTFLFGDEHNKYNFFLANNKITTNEKFTEEFTLKCYKDTEESGIVFKGKSSQTESSDLTELYASYYYGKFLIDLKEAIHYGDEETDPLIIDFNFEGKYPNHRMSHVKFNTYTKIDLTARSSKFLKFATKNGLICRSNLNQKKTLLDLKVDANVDLESSKGLTKIAVIDAHSQPITVDFMYAIVDKPRKFSVFSNVLVTYGKNEQVKSDFTLELMNRLYTTKFNFNHPRISPISVESVIKELTLEKVNQQIFVTVGNKKYEAIQEIDRKSINPTYNLKIKYPNGETDTAKWSLDLTERDRAIWLVLINFRALDFYLQNNVDALYKDMKNFAINIKFHCPNLKVGAITLNLEHKPITLNTATVTKQPSQHLDADVMATQTQSDAQQLHFDYTNTGQNVIAFRSHYRCRQVQTEYIVEGSGSTTIGTDKPIKHNFQLKYDNRYVHNYKSIGESYSLNFKIENVVIDAEMKYTQEILQVLTKYCQPNSPCFLIKMDADFNRDYSYFHHTSVVDLRLFEGPEIKLNGFYNAVMFNYDKQFRCESELILNSNQYVFKLDKLMNKCIVVLTTPYRTISLEGFVKPPRDPSKQATSYEINYYANKIQHPKQKTSLSGYYQHVEGKVSGFCNFEIKLQDPTLSKDLRITYNGDYNNVKLTANENLVIDVFDNENYKIISTISFNGKTPTREGIKSNMLYEIKSTGLNLDIKYEEKMFVRVREYQEVTYDALLKLKFGQADYDSSVSSKVNKQHVEYGVKFFNKELFYISMKPSISPLVLHSNLRFIGGPPCAARFEFSNLRGSLIVRFEDKPHDELRIIGNFNQQLALDVQYMQSGRMHYIFSAHSKLNNDDQIHFNYLYNDRNGDLYIAQPFNKYYKNSIQQVKEIKYMANRHLDEQLSSVINKASNNVANIQHFIDYHWPNCKAIVRELSADKVLVQTWNFMYYSVLLPVHHCYTHTIHPQLNRLFYSIEKFAFQCRLNVYYFFKNILNATDVAIHRLVNVYVALYKSIAEYMNTPPGSEIQIYLGKLLSYSINVANKIGKTLVALFNDIEAVKVFEELDKMLSQALGGGTVPEEYIRSFEEVMHTLASSTDSKVLKHFIIITNDYILHKLRGEAVDDVAAIDKIYEALIQLILEFFETIENDGTSLSKYYNSDYWFAIDIAEVIYPDFHYQINNIYSVLDEYKLPKQFDAAVVHGEHILTFDGKEITVQGNCDYVLAHDAVNANFSIVGLIQSRSLSSITFADKTDIVTLSKDGVVTLNNAVRELPIRKEHRLEVFEGYEGITIWSKAGVRILCDRKLLVCSFHVSGYYHAQLRGLLGNANHDPFDDYTSVNGLIETPESTLIPNYGINSHCQPIDPSISVPSNVKCTRLFLDRASSLWPCFNTVNPKPYKTACDKATKYGKEEAMHSITTAYVRVCTAKNIKVKLPRRFTQCTNFDSPKRVAETFKVTTPRKAADIVFLVDQNINNKRKFKSFLQPLVDELTKSFKKENINDIDYHFIGYGGEYEKRVYHYRVEGKMISKNGQIPAIEFSKQLSESNRETFKEYLYRIAEEGDLLTGQDMVRTAYFEALKYPFRAHAVKSIIVVNGKPCSNKNVDFLLSFAESLLVNQLYTVNLFTSIKETPNQHINTEMIGFNKNYVYNFDVQEGIKILYKSQFENVCIKFALKNRGNVFVLDNFKNGPTKNEDFIKTSVKAIIEELVNVKQGLECTCDMVTPYFGQNVCKVKYTTKREPSNTNE